MITHGIEVYQRCVHLSLGGRVNWVSQQNKEVIMKIAYKSQRTGMSLTPGRILMKDIMSIVLAFGVVEGWVSCEKFSFFSFL